MGTLEGRDLLADKAYKEIQNAILSNRLVPGASLSVPELARQMAISRSPVREAVQRLVHEGLAISVPYHGAEVMRVTIEDLQNLYEVREVLEGLAALRATERLDEVGRGELESTVAKHERVLAEEKGFIAHMELDMRFHSLIRDYANNHYLTEPLVTLQGKVRLAMHSLWRSDDAPHRALEDHKKILAAISSGDPAAAESEARMHIARIRIALAENREEL